MTCADGSRHVAWVVVGMAPGGLRLLGEARFFRSASGDEAENADTDLTFISRTPGSTFDDLVTWIVPSILKAKMVAAGRLP